MKLTQFAIAALFCVAPTSAFVSSPIKSQSVATLNASSTDIETSLNANANANAGRRSFLSKAGVAFSAAAAGTIILPGNANAIPGITVAEFESIMRTSARSISIVEFSGSKSETAIVTLLDGTTFSITDLFESSTDPRSPLKLIASCRSYKVPTKNVGLEDALSSFANSGSKKKRVYMNERVRVAAEKERAKKIRMDEDERERLSETLRMGI
mmetsp:Transcript_7242/g.10330  ORF Transcript_7242/g.10330 Transcript_7242/m.10330 type:complete len:212 (+) Transcript_7242:100-735(+)